MSTMHRARRVALVAALAVVGALGLTGCRSQPGVAAYVGSTSYTQKQVDKLAKTIPGIEAPQGRQLVLSWLVQRDVAKRLVTDNGWAAPKVDLEAANSSGLPPGGSITRLYAEFQAYYEAVQQHATPKQPTDADFADLYRRAKAAGLVQPGMQEAQYREALGPQNLQVLSNSLGVRSLFVDGIRKAHVTINPRYAPAEVTLLSDQQRHPLVVIPLNTKDGGSAVVSKS